MSQSILHKVVENGSIGVVASPIYGKEWKAEIGEAEYLGKQIVILPGIGSALYSLSCERVVVIITAVALVIVGCVPWREKKTVLEG